METRVPKVHQALVYLVTRVSVETMVTLETLAALVFLEIEAQKANLVVLEATALQGKKVTEETQEEMASPELMVDLGRKEKKANYASVRMDSKVRRENLELRDSLELMACLASLVVKDRQETGVVQVTQDSQAAMAAMESKEKEENPVRPEIRVLQDCQDKDSKVLRETVETMDSQVRKVNEEATEVKAKRVPRETEVKMDSKETLAVKVLGAIKELRDYRDLLDPKELSGNRLWARRAREVSRANQARQVAMDSPASLEIQARPAREEAKETLVTLVTPVLTESLDAKEAKAWWVIKDFKEAEESQVVDSRGNAVLMAFPATLGSEEKTVSLGVLVSLVTMGYQVLMQGRA